MGLQTYDGCNVRLQQAGRSNADVLQLSGAAVCEGRPRSDSREDDPYTVP